MASSDVTEMADVSLSALKTMQLEMESRRLILTKSWDELSHLMSQYHSSLVLKHEEMEQCTQSTDTSKFARLAQTVNRKDDEIKRYCKMISDLETKLLNKDSEIVCLRAENRKLIEDSTMKNNLLNKLQAQMAREALEYSSEINALKEILESGDSEPRKRRRVVQDNGEPEAIVTQYETDSSPPTTAENCRLFDPPTFSIATMPHLTLPTTSAEALNLNSVDANDAGENDNERFSKLYEVVEHEERDESDGNQAWPNRTSTVGSFGSRARNVYNNLIKVKMAQYVENHGLRAAVAHFSQKLGHKVNPSTVFYIKKKYNDLLREFGTERMQDITARMTGRGGGRRRRF